MSGPSYTGVVEGGLRVTKRIDGAHPRHKDYPLLPGDLMFKGENGTFDKFGPGLGIVGFVLTPEQEASLEEAPPQAYGIGDATYAFGEE